MTWQDHTGPSGATIPVAELDGGAPGPTWLFTAGVHGDEYEGPEAIRRAVAQLTGARFPGKVIAAPIVNPMAYAKGVRCTPEDGVNLNRAFPGRADGTISHQWAAWFWTTFAARADRLIDLHAGGVAFAFDAVAGFYASSDAPLAAMFGLTLWRCPDTPGVFSREFRQRRGPAVGAELGFGGVRDEAATENAAVALVRLANKHTAPVAGPIFGNVDVLAERSGEWRARVGITQPVTQGQPLGEIMDWRGRRVETIVSPCAGRVLAVRRLVSVSGGELVAGIGTNE